MILRRNAKGVWHLVMDAVDSWNGFPVRVISEQGQEGALHGEIYFDEAVVTIDLRKKSIAADKAARPKQEETE